MTRSDDVDDDDDDNNNNSCNLHTLTAFKFLALGLYRQSRRRRVYFSITAVNRQETQLSLV